MRALLLLVVGSFAVYGADIQPLAVAPPSPPSLAFGWSEPPAAFPPASQPVTVTFTAPWRGAFTIAGWINHEKVVSSDSTSSEAPPTIAFVTEKDSHEAAIQFTVTDGKLSLAVRRGKEWSSVKGITAVPLNQWVHVAAQCDAQGDLHLFLNGKEDGKRSGKLSSVLLNEMRIGAYGKRVLNGQISSMSFFPGPLAASAIADLAAAKSSQGTASLLQKGLPLAVIPPHSDELVDYSSHRLQVSPDASLPIAAGLKARCFVMPASGGRLPDIMLQSFGFGCGRIFYPNAYRAENGVPDRFPFSSGTFLPRLTVMGNICTEAAFPCEINNAPGLITTEVSPATGFTELFFLPQSPRDPKEFEEAVPIPCGPEGLPYAMAYQGARLSHYGDVDRDGVPDLLLVKGVSSGSYYPDAPKNFWTGEDLPNSGPGKGYTVNGVWLGEESLQEFYWAKGSLGATGMPTFGKMMPIIQGDKDYQLRWKGYFGATSTAINIGGQPHLVLIGDLDRVLAMPFTVRDGTIYCGQAADLLEGGKRLRYCYITVPPNVADMDGDGVQDLVVGGNPGAVSILSGTKVGDFTERQGYTYGGPLAMQTLIVQSRVDWNGDGLGDIVAGDSSGWLMLWPGTADPKTYGSPSNFKVDGKPVFIQAGYRGSIQGPNEARWGYLNPTACDWDGDGKSEIITGDINADLFLWRRGDSDLELKAPERFTKDGVALPVAWRQHPAFIPGSDRLAGDERPCLLIQDYDGDLALAVPKEQGGTEIERVEKLKYQDGADIRTCGPCGAWGRSKFVWADWDEDGVKDVIYSTNRASNRFIIQEELGRRCVLLFLKNVGTTQKPVFARPQVLKFQGEYLNFGTHIAAPWIMDGEGIPKNSLIIGAEDGRVYFFDRKGIAP